ncbi:MAG TPA: family 43 glycosylhydrolase, partial [Bryobacteraceae bacterium]|nr:family 43 glycosylhydrolase [Bryobacteraceae bacterium]
LYRRGGYYYLLTAEGGTGWGHAVTLCRSRDLAGPYELHPDTYIVTARHRPDLEMQRAGHADIVETHTGETYLVHLCGRPLRNRGRCTLGRETAIQRMAWNDDGWLRTADGKGLPYSEVPAPSWRAHAFPAPSVREDFGRPDLPIDFQWLRSPYPEELFSLTERPGHLRLYGRETLGSWFRQALVARRQQAHCFSAATVVDFQPEDFQQMAGLVYYYNAGKYHYLFVSHDEAVGRHLRVMTCNPDLPAPDFTSEAFPLPAAGPVHLRVEVDYERLRFACRVGSERWRWLPGMWDASILSDESGPAGPPNFTGAFVGMACQDLRGSLRPADFDYFAYRERDFLADAALAPDPSAA